MEVHNDFRELLECFNARGVEYLVIGGVSWDEAWAGRAPGDCGGVPVHYLGREQFIANKRAAGRPKDLADLEALGETD